MSEKMPHKLLIDAEIDVKSELKSYVRPYEVVRGDGFTIAFKVQNIGDAPFPGGKITSLRLQWIGKAEAELAEGEEIESLKPGDTFTTPAYALYGTLPGDTWLHLAIAPNDNAPIEYYKTKGGKARAEFELLLYAVERELLQIIRLLEELKGKGGTS